ncbi:MAG: sigma-70 family RNA polymerase sigma factor [Pirellulales bacterium]|nr:sigma-70 family RNA polymerase sigma factor [Pirellulales bacterium]
MFRSDPCSAQPADLSASLAAVRGGSNSKLGQLLDAYRDFLLVVATDALDTNVQPKVARSDLVQESLLQAVRDFPRFQGTTEPELRAWLKQILLNNVCDAHRRFQKAGKRNVSREIPLRGTNSSAAGVLHHLAVEDRPLSNLAAREEQARVESSLATLEADQRQAIELRSLQGLPFEEVGRRMNRSTEAARKLWSRAVQKLALDLGRKSDDERSST